LDIFPVRFFLRYGGAHAVLLQDLLKISGPNATRGNRAIFRVASIRKWFYTLSIDHKLWR